MIIQCPHCMSIFCVKEDDIVKSKTDEGFVNVAEVCQHCGNDSGYILIGIKEDVSEVDVENIFDMPFFKDSHINNMELNMDSLTEIQKKIINLRYYKDKTQNEIAKELGISQSRVSQIEKEALKKIFK